ncbi:hypothetical protein ACROYT_G025032 [Oculina patagonica]
MNWGKFKPTKELRSESSPWQQRHWLNCCSGVAWVNTWHQSFHIHCSNSYSLRNWRSQHRNCKEDRIHYFQCGYGPVRYHHGNCAETHGWVNNFDQPLHFKCPYNGFIAGVRSYYHGHYRDRRFGFRCCHVNGYIAHTCQTTLFRNNYDQELNYWVPSPYYLVGVYSQHHNHYEDRIWKFDICQFKYAGKK